MDRLRLAFSTEYESNGTANYETPWDGVVVI